MSNPKFLNIEKKVPYSVRLPQRLIDKLNSYAELNGNTTTNIINNVLNDFLADRIVLNDYLDNIGAVTVEIPFATHQKYHIINNGDNLMKFNLDNRIFYYNGVDTISETLESELFEVKKIPNNLDIYNGDSYVANKNILKFNKNAIHSGIELFIYNITEIIFADALIVNYFDSFLKCLYCLYFEVSATNQVDLYLIDYLSAINLLSVSGNDEYKDLIIAAASELTDVDAMPNEYLMKIDDISDEFIAELNDIPELELLKDDDAKSDKIEELKEKHLPEIKSAIRKEYIQKCHDKVGLIANKYNSNNIIPFGSDIFSRLAIKEIDVASPEFDKLIDQLVTEKVDEIFDDKIGELEKTSADIHAKIDNINKIIESELNKNK